MLEYSLPKGDVFMNEDIIISMLKEKYLNQKKELSFDDYMEVLNNNEVKIFLTEKYKNITSYTSQELLRKNYLYQQLLEIYFQENDIELIDNEEDYTQDFDDLFVYFNEINNYKILTREEEFELFTTYAKTKDKAIKEKIANHNLRLVITIAKKYSKNNVDSFKDAIQDGNEGLLIAIDKFDITKGNKFSTYATFWIKQAIIRNNINFHNNIRIPVYQYEKSRKLNKYTADFVKKYGYEPNDEYLASKLDMTVDKLNELRTKQLKSVSLDTEIGETEHGEVSTLMDFIKDESPEADVEQLIMIKNMIEDVRIMLNSLPKKERDILELRFGLKDGNDYTLVEVGKMFNVTRERIRQIEARTLHKLKRSYHNKEMKDYLEQ